MGKTEAYTWECDGCYTSETTSLDILPDLWHRAQLDVRHRPDKSRTFFLCGICIAAVSGPVKPRGFWVTVLKRILRSGS